LLRDWIPLQSSGGIPAVDERQAHVHQNQVRQLRFGRIDACLAIDGNQYVEAAPL